MDEPKKLTTRQQQAEQEQAQAIQNSQATPVSEFATVEEMLRHDARHTVVPPSVERRLRDSVAKESPGQASWWRRLFGGTKE